MEEVQAEATPVPQQRFEQAAPTSAQVVRSLGLDALVEILEQSAYGVVVTDEHHRWMYLNPAGCRAVGRPFEDLYGEDYVLSFVEHERAAMLGLEQDQREGDTGFYANTLVRPDGTQIGITWSGTAVTVEGRELAPAFFHPTSALGHLEPGAGALAAASEVLSSGGNLDEVLAGLVQAAVTGSRAAACLLVVADSDDRLDVAASAGVPQRVVDGLDAARLRLSDLPGGELLAEGRVVLLSDERSLLRDRPAAALRDLLALSWEASAKVPLHRAGRLVGSLVLLLPPAVIAPTETELTSWLALAAHASAALSEERLRAQATQHAAELERQRLGRDLHDSVSAALFSLHTRAQVVRRAAAAGDPELAALAAQDMESLARQAIAELRQTVSDMRSSGAVDLVAGLHSLAGATCRDGLPVDVRVSRALPTLPAATVEHLLRIASEALHNCVKHADATHAVLEVGLDPDALVLVVADDGRGFDPTAVPVGRHGQRTMRERAALCRGELAVESTPGGGTRVHVRVPVPA